MGSVRRTTVRPGRSRRSYATLAMAVLIVAGAGWWIRPLVAPSAIERGVSAYGRGDWNTAYRQARERLDVAGNDPEALRLLARASARLGRHPEARTIYSGLDPGRLEAEDFCLLATGQALAGRAIEGRGLLGMALDADPDHAESLDLLARLALETGQVPEAIRAAERLARRPGHEARADLLLGVIHATDQDPAAAASSLRRALGRDPGIRILPSDPFGTPRLLARALLQTGRPGEALDTLRPILDAGPDPEASWLASRAYLQSGMGAEAISARARSGNYRTEHPLDPEPAPYLGAARCAGCHADVNASVLASRHARTLRRGRELADLPLPDGSLADPGDPQVLHSFRRDDDRVRAEARVRDRVLRAVVEYALGATDRYTSLIGPDDQGRYRTLRLSYHRGAEGAGWDLTKAQAEHPARVEDYLGEPFPSEAAARECLICHTTNPRAIRDGTGPEAHDRGIGCERCHGPGGLHPAAVALKFPESAIASPAGASAAEINRLCGDCHSQHFLAMPAARDAPDWTRFPGSTLPWSRCYTESGGALSCLTCHDPHRDAATAPSHYESKCLSCHATPRQAGKPGASPPASRQGAIRRPCPVNPAADCLGCHMPRVRYDWLHGGFTDHYIRVHADGAPKTQGAAARGSTTGASPSRRSQG